MWVCRCFFWGFPWLVVLDAGQKWGFSVLRQCEDCDDQPCLPPFVNCILLLAVSLAQISQQSLMRNVQSMTHQQQPHAQKPKDEARGSLDLEGSFPCLLACLFACFLVCLLACLLVSLFACLLAGLLVSLFVCLASLFACLLLACLFARFLVCLLGFLVCLLAGLLVCSFPCLLVFCRGALFWVLSRLLYCVHTASHMARFPTSWIRTAASPSR